MFIKTHTQTIGESAIPVTFIKSTNVKAFPCGRRRSTEISTEYRIPFDPEARLNTEANNRKHSGLNGFKHTYINSWDKETGELSIVLAGYIFSIMLPDEVDDSGKLIKSYKNEETFCEAIITSLNTLDSRSIYANILMQNTPLFSGEFLDSSLEYETSVLRNQSGSDLADASLDLYIDDTASNDISKYYFSGLSFSTYPLTCDESTHSTAIVQDAKQTIVSLHLLEKYEGSWKIYEQARLPNIEHGDTEDSVVLGDTAATRVTTQELVVSNDNNSSRAYADNIEATNAKISNIESTVVNVTRIKEDGTIEETIDLDGASGEITAQCVSAGVVTATKELSAAKLRQNGKTVPFITVAQSGSQYQLQITIDPSAK